MPLHEDILEDSMGCFELSSPEYNLIVVVDDRNCQARRRHIVDERSDESPNTAVAVCPSSLSMVYAKHYIVRGTVRGPAAHIFTVILLIE